MAEEMHEQEEKNHVFACTSKSRYSPFLEIQNLVQSAKLRQAVYEAGKKANKLHGKRHAAYML